MLCAFLLVVVHSPSRSITLKANPTTLEPSSQNEGRKKKLETHLIVEKHTVRRAEEESIKKQE
jgi:hypothetical protein